MNVCHSCATVVANCDTSHVDPCDLDHIEATLESVGRVVVGARVEGYIRCFLCNWDHMNGYAFEVMD